jgi:hypothetical protein
LGLRHNFEASWDALNYDPRYWELREQTFDRCNPEAITFSSGGWFSGAVAPPLCEGQGDESFDEYMARSADLVEDLLEQNIHQYQNSSVMEYVAKQGAMADGIGLYDYAAIAYGYGELREVFQNAPHKIYVSTTYDNETDEFTSSEIHVSDQLVQTFDDVDEFFIRRRNLIEGDEPSYQREEEAEHEHSYEYYHYSTLPIMFQGDMQAAYERRLVPVDAIGDSVVVPYRFCSDEYLDTAIECAWFDQGADYLERFMDVRDTFEGTYLLRFFRRDRAGWGLWLYPFINGLYARYMAPMTRLYQHWLIKASGRGSAWYNSSWGGSDASTAAFAAIDFLSQVVTRPTVGTYYYDDTEDRYLNIDDETGYTAPFHVEIDENIGPEDYLDVDLDVGRYGFEQFRRNEDEELGYYGFFETEVQSWFWAKWTAMMALTLPEVEIIGQDTSSDSTAFSIPIYLIFPDELTQFFGAIPREDFNQVGGCVVGDGERGNARVVLRNLVTDDPDECNGAVELNPYSEIFGNSDFNMRLLSILYASAYFQTNYSNNWFDASNVYILGRGYTLEPGEGFTYETYTHDNGVQYAAVREEPAEGEELDEDALDLLPGIQFVRQMQSLRAERDAEYELNGESSLYWDTHYNLEGLLEDVRLLNQANSLFEGWNVFMPFSL